MLQPPTKVEQIKLGVYDPSKSEVPPTLLEFKQWLINVARTFCQFLHETNLVESCFWQHYKNKIVSQTSAAAIFYLSTCQDLFEVEEREINCLLKGSTIKWFKLKRKPLVKMFDVSEPNFVLAIRKIKASPDLVRIRIQPTVSQPQKTSGFYQSMTKVDQLESAQDHRRSGTH